MKFFFSNFALFSTALLLLIHFSVKAQIKLPVVIGDNMVLQRGQNVPVWGKASPGSRLKVTFAGQSKYTRAAEDSSWRVDLDPLAASFQPAAMVISSGKKAIKISNILVGEVWLCSGQSNMAYMMDRADYAPPHRGVDSAALELRNVNDNIRLFKVDDVLFGKPQKLSNGWQQSGGGALAKFSTIGYYFAKNIQFKLKVPVGMLFSAVNGTPIEFWTPASAYDLDPGQKALIDNETFMTDKRKGTLYEQMIRPLAPFAIKGFLWYQGESNCIANENTTYPIKLKVMANAWRKVWGKDNLPLYTVLIGPYKYTNWSGAIQSPQNLPLFWEAQKQIPKNQNMEIICISDLVDDLRDIHPSYKWEVGRRLSLIALNKAYNNKNIEYSGPRFDHLEVQKNEAIVYFSHVDGLKTIDGASPNYFSVAGSDNIFYRAAAKIVGGKVILSSGNVPNPIHVQFAWDETAQPNLVNYANLPAFPFSTN